MSVWSAGALQLRSSLNNAFDLDLSATVVYDHPSIAALATFIRSQLVALGLAHQPQRQQPSQQLMDWDASQSTKGGGVHPDAAQLPYGAHTNVPSAYSSLAPQRSLKGLHTVMVGASGRYPHAFECGGIAGLWQHLLQNADLPTCIPLQRWDIERYYRAEEPGQPGMMYVHQGSFMSNIDAFDNALFR